MLHGDPQPHDGPGLPLLPGLRRPQRVRRLLLRQLPPRPRVYQRGLSPGGPEGQVGLLPVQEGQKHEPVVQTQEEGESGYLLLPHRLPRLQGG